MRKYQVWLDGRIHQAEQVIVESDGYREYTGDPGDLQAWWDSLSIGERIGRHYTKVTTRHVRYDGGTSALVFVDDLVLHILREYANV